ncbi:MAG: hypothetical protein B6242_15340 [Anaerolineaceae bacterium 4572_78]|nr:MAG: hypothetical protein B6242_15340 [Anaerolineaceae bacterium 4572_78]
MNIIIEWLTYFFDWLILPNPDTIKKIVDEIRTDNPDLNTDDLVEIIIEKQSFKSGIIGAVTGIGGCLVLPITFFIDLVLSGRTNTSMIYMMAYAHGHDPKHDDLRFKSVVIMAGESMTHRLTHILAKFVAETLFKSLVKFVPLIGAVLGFLVNRQATEAVGHLTKKSYQQKNITNSNDHILPPTT